MANGIQQSIDQTADAYRSNPQGLAQKYQQNQALIDLLALQKLKSEKEAAARDMQMKMQSNPQTIAEQREQEVLAMTKNDMAQQVGGILQQKQQQSQKNIQQVANTGIAGVPAPNMARMAKGGIVNFKAGGYSSGDIDGYTGADSMGVEYNFTKQEIPDLIAEAEAEIARANRALGLATSPEETARAKQRIATAQNEIRELNTSPTRGLSPIEAYMNEPTLNLSGPSPSLLEIWYGPLALGKLAGQGINALTQFNRKGSPMTEAQVKGAYAKAYADKSIPEPPKPPIDLSRPDTQVPTPEQKVSAQDQQVPAQSSEDMSGIGPVYANGQVPKSSVSSLLPKQKSMEGLALEAKNLQSIMGGSEMQTLAEQEARRGLSVDPAEVARKAREEQLAFTDLTPQQKAQMAKTREGLAGLVARQADPERQRRERLISGLISAGGGTNIGSTLGGYGAGSINTGAQQYKGELDNALGMAKFDVGAIQQDLGIRKDAFTGGATAGKTAELARTASGQNATNLANQERSGISNLISNLSSQQNEQLRAAASTLSDASRERIAANKTVADRIAAEVKAKDEAGRLTPKDRIAAETKLAENLTEARREIFRDNAQALSMARTEEEVDAVKATIAREIADLEAVYAPVMESLRSGFSAKIRDDVSSVSNTFPLPQ